MRKKDLCNRLQKVPYEKPLTEQVVVLSEGVMLPQSWNDGQGNQMGIYEDAPDGDGKGAKDHMVIDVNGRNGMWDD